jgi:hypothetical protein
MGFLLLSIAPMAITQPEAYSTNGLRHCTPV